MCALHFCAHIIIARNVCIPFRMCGHCVRVCVCYDDSACNQIIPIWIIFLVIRFICKFNSNVITAYTLYCKSNRLIDTVTMRCKFSLPISNQIWRHRDWNPNKCIAHQTVYVIFNKLSNNENSSHIFTQYPKQFRTDNQNQTNIWIYPKLFAECTKKLCSVQLYTVDYWNFM